MPRCKSSQCYIQANMRDRKGKNAQSLRQGGGVNTYCTLSADSAILDWPPLQLLSVNLRPNKVAICSLLRF